MVCFDYGIYGHKLEECPLKGFHTIEGSKQNNDDTDPKGGMDLIEVVVPVERQGKTKSNSTIILEASPCHGPWILVDNSKRRKGRGSQLKSSRDPAVVRDRSRRSSHVRAVL